MHKIIRIEIIIDKDTYKVFFVRRVNYKENYSLPKKCTSLDEALYIAIGKDLILPPDGKIIIDGKATQLHTISRLMKKDSFYKERVIIATKHADERPLKLRQANKVWYI